MDGRYATRIDGIYGGGLIKEEQSAATSALSKLVAEKIEVIFLLLRLWLCVIRTNPDERRAINAVLIESKRTRTRDARSTPS